MSGAAGFHVLAKPAGPACNLDCAYCFYLEKEALFPPRARLRMTDEVLEAFVREYVTAQPTPFVEFVWQGGEPTLLGLDFFRRVVELQAPFASRKTITNSLQTNGTRLTAEWCDFLRDHGFLVGISLDGPGAVHDRYRRDHQGRGSFESVMRGLRLLQEHRVPYNVLACVGRETAKQPLEVYRFLRDEGVEFVQFTPVVEREPDARIRELGLRLAGPASLAGEAGEPTVTPWSVVPEDYGNFLVAVFDEWVHHDVGRVFVLNFEWALNAWLGNPAPVCLHARRCGRSLAVEHDGDVYACDHYVYPEHRLGNVLTDTFPAMLERAEAGGVGAGKESALPPACLDCDVLSACRGACPKHRFLRTARGDPGLHYLCAAYRRFFHHVPKYLRAMATLLENGLPASYVMDAARGPLVLPVADSRAHPRAPQGRP